MANQVNIQKTFSQKFQEALPTLGSVGMVFLVMGLVSSFFGHSHISDDGAWIGNPFYGLGITTAIIGGIIVSVAMYRHYREQNPHEEIEGGLNTILAIVKGSYYALKNTPLRITGRRFGVALACAGVMTIALAAIHINFFSTGLTVDVTGILLGTGVGVLGAFLAFYFHKNKN